MLPDFICDGVNVDSLIAVDLEIFGKLHVLEIVRSPLRIIATEKRMFTWGRLTHPPH